MDPQYEAMRVGMMMDGKFGSLKVTEVTIQVNQDEFNRLSAMPSPRQIIVKYNDGMGHDSRSVMKGLPSVVQVTVEGQTIFELTWKI